MTTAEKNVAPTPARKAVSKSVSIAIPKAASKTTAVRKPAAPKAKAATKSAVKKPGAAPAKATLPALSSNLAKSKKPKMVRDSLTIPKLEYAVLDVLKLRAAKLAQPAKKTELIRAGIKAIAALSDAAFLAALRAVPSLKTGRPARVKSAKATKAV